MTSCYVGQESILEDMRIEVKVYDLKDLQGVIIPQLLASGFVKDLPGHYFIAL